MDKRTRIVIVGGGIAGLTLAHGLRQAGFQPRIFEREVTPGPLGGLGIYRNALLVLERLGLLDTLKERGNEVDRTVLLDPSGATLVELESPKVVILRARLHETLSETLPDGMIRFDHKFTALGEQGGHLVVSFENGHREECDLLIGADGIHSSVAEALFGPISTHYNNYIYRGLVPRDPTLPLRTMFVVMGYGHKYHQICLNEMEVGWSITTNEAERRTALPPEEIQAMLIERVRDWNARAEEFIRATKPEHMLQHSVYDRPPLKRWYDSRTVLIGDAAHPQHPALGQGACMAIESAAVLTACIERYRGVEEAFAVYERIRKRRTGFLFSQSRRMARMGQLQRPFLCRLRNNFMRWNGARPGIVGVKRINHQVIFYDVFKTIEAEIPVATAK